MSRANADWLVGFRGDEVHYGVAGTKDELPAKRRQKNIDKTVSNFVLDGVLGVEVAFQKGSTSGLCQTEAGTKIGTHAKRNS
jgi:hypothetical protein